MIKPTAIVPCQGQCVELVESSAQTKYAVKIYDMPNQDQCIIIKADAFPAPNGIFANTKHECKRADFVIIADTDKKKVVLCIEIKAGKGDSTEIVQQLKGAQCFVVYCQEIGRSFWNNHDFLKRYEYRFVSIRNISISKRPTHNERKNHTHNTPEKMLRINAQKQIGFYRLV